MKAALVAERPYRGYCIHRPRSDIRDRARHSPLGQVAAVRGARRRPAPSVTEQPTMGEATFRQHNCGVQRPRAGRPLSECFRAAQRRSNDSAGRRNEQLVAARPLSERSIVFERLRGLLDLAEGGQVVALTSVAAFRAEQRPFGLVPGGRRSGERRRESEGAPFGSRSAFCDTLVQCGGLRCDCWC